MRVAPSPAKGGYAKYATSAYPQTFGELLDWSLARVANPEQKVYFRIVGQAPVTYEMPYFMVPRFLVLRQELPKTATLRVEKYKLQRDGLANAVDRKQLGIELQR